MINSLTKITPQEAFYLFASRHKDDLLLRLDQAIAFYLETASKIRSLENRDLEKEAQVNFKVGSIETLTICFLTENTSIIQDLLEDKTEREKWLQHIDRSNHRRFIQQFRFHKMPPGSTSRFTKKRREIARQIEIIKKDIQIANSLLNVFAAIKKI